MALWKVLIFPEWDEPLDPLQDGRAYDVLEASGSVKSASFEQLDGPEQAQLALVVDASDRADACSTACSAAICLLGEDMPFACTTMPVAG